MNPSYFYVHQGYKVLTHCHINLYQPMGSMKIHLAPTVTPPRGVADSRFRALPRWSQWNEARHLTPGDAKGGNKWNNHNKHGFVARIAQVAV